MWNRQGKLLVISGPSGAGKSTVIRKLMELRRDTTFSVSATTRAPREGEQNGIHYHFLDKPRFQEMIAAGEFLEHAEYVGNLYGTPRTPVMEQLENGLHVILDIDVQGALQVRNAVSDAVLVFLTPPDAAELEKRLRGRGTDSDEQIRRRLTTAQEEVRLAARYDYIVVNDDPAEAAGELSAILTAEQCRAVRRCKTICEVFEA